MKPDELADALEFYAPDTTARVGRFVQVAKYLSEHDLWDAVADRVHVDSVANGDRVVVDHRLANAVKLVLVGHAGRSLASDADVEPIVEDAVKCGGKPRRSRGSGGGGIRG